MKFRLLFAVVFLALAGEVLFAQTVLENFDGTYPVPGWDCDSVTRVDATVTDPHSAPYCAMLDDYLDYLITSLVVDPGILTFWHKKETGNASSFYVQVSSSTNGPWTTIATIAAGLGWTQATYDLSAYSNIYIRWIFVGPPPPTAQEIYLDDISWIDYTLPVELSSFTCTATVQNYVMLEWVTQSETNVSGYYLYRNYSNNLNSALRINAFINATNTSQETSYAFVDREAVPGYTWYYWLEHIEMNGNSEFHGPVSITLADTNPNPPIIPQVTGLQMIYPNPSGPRANISYGLAKASPVDVKIFNTKGKLIRQLYIGSKNAGTYKLVWDGLDDNGQPVTSGFYLVRMVAGKESSVLKLNLLK